MSQDVRTYTADEIENISLQSLIKTQPIITNTGLSEELIKELCGDLSDDVFIELLNIEINGEWRTYCNNPTELKGVDENGTPIYVTNWNGEEWLYIPFNVTLSSAKSSGEIVGGSISIQNFDKDIALTFEAPAKAIPYKLYIISKKTGECVFKDELKYITGIHNNGILIQGDTRPADIFAEPLPSMNYNAYNFKR